MPNSPDIYTGKKRIIEYYSDFFDSFIDSPIGNDLARLTNERAVTQSIKNLVYTNLQERLYQPLVGTDIFRSLFEPNDVISASNIQFNIINTLKYYEPRANKVSVSVTNDTENYTLIITITYYLINNPSPIDVVLNLRRVR